MTQDMITMFTSAFQQVAADAASMLAIIIPVAVSVAGVVWVSKKAMAWFKGIGGKGG